LISFLYKANKGLGFIILNNPRSNNVVLNKGNNIPYSMWKGLINKLVQLEGQSNVNEGDVPGCWYVQENKDRIIADWILNGNQAHRYCPRTSIDADSLVELISNLKA